MPGVPAGAMPGVPGGVSGEISGAVFTGDGDQSGRSACDWRGSGPFNGMTDMSRRDGRDFIHERVGRQGHDLVIQKTFNTLRVCAFAQGLSNDNGFPRPGTWTSQSSHVVLETQEPNLTRRMEIAGGTTTYSVNGQPRPVDDAAREWAERLTDVLDAVWELRMLRGQESSLRGQISSIQGQRSSLQGEISSLRGQVSSMQGTISSLQGQESSLRGQISSIQGHLSSLRGAISSEQGAISSLQASRWERTEAERRQIADRIAQHEKAISRIEAEIRAYDAESKIREVERQIARQDVRSRIAEVEANIRRFDVESKVAQVGKRIAELDVEDRVAAVERAIAALEAPRRSRELDLRLVEALRRLEDALAKLR
jgi:hypothetical protein